MLCLRVLLIVSSLTSLFIEPSSAEYFGALVGQLTPFYHDVTGRVYVINSRALRVVGFNYDGSAPDAHFTVGVHGAGSSPDERGIVVPTVKEGSSPLGSYYDSDVMLSLPQEIESVTEVLWLSVWCVQFSVDFGHIIFPSPLPFTLPGPHNLGEFSRLAHQVRSGNVIIEDIKTITINDLFYDGQGPDAYFLVGFGGEPGPHGTKVPDERGSLGILRGYEGQDVTLTLPNDLTVFNITWLSMYCITYTHNFGQVNFPAAAQLNVPPYIPGQVGKDSNRVGQQTGGDDQHTEREHSADEVLQHCVELSPTLQVSWSLGTDYRPYIVIEIQGIINEGEYMSFGPSGSSSSSSMLRSDIIIVSREQGRVKTQDYYIASYGVCRDGDGVCPDITFGGSSDITVISATVEDGVTRSRFSRPLSTGDRGGTDNIITIDRSMHIVWAVGPVNEDGTIIKHTRRVPDDVTIYFGGSDHTFCSPLLDNSIPASLPSWGTHTILGQNQTSFNAQIGPAGGVQGYAAMTGMESWSKAWYIDGELIPEIYVRRGQRYLFLIHGGDDETDNMHYHPFYISDDQEGGYAHKPDKERQIINVYAGIEKDGSVSEGAVGRFCELQITEPQPLHGYKSFDEFSLTLQRHCSPGPPGQLYWTPDRNTPDVVYYQSYTHKHMGWKIHVTADATSVYTSSGVLIFLLTSATLLIHRDNGSI